MLMYQLCQQDIAPCHSSLQFRLAGDPRVQTKRHLTSANRSTNWIPPMNLFHTWVASWNLNAEAIYGSYLYLTCWCDKHRVLNVGLLGMVFDICISVRKLVQNAQRQVVDVYGGEEIGHGSEQCDILSMNCSGLPRHWV